MAIHIKRLSNAINSQKSIFNPISWKSYIHVSHASLQDKFIPTFTSHRDFSTCSAGVTEHKTSGKLNALLLMQFNTNCFLVLLVPVAHLSLPSICSRKCFFEKHSFYFRSFNDYDSALTHTCIIAYAYNPRLEDDLERNDHEFLKWHKGGGIFHKSASIDPSALIDFGAVVHSGSLVGSNVHVGSGAIIGPNVTIGQSTKIGFNVALANCTIGDSCVIHHGVCIGQDGFGFFLDDKGAMVKKPQDMKVDIGNNVEIGANSCIDRGSWRDTMIGDHSKIDNLVQIGHNVVIGKCCMLCGQVGIAGSVTIGDYVTLGGRVGVRDHVTIVSKVRLAASSCVTKDITKPGDYGGFPAIPIHEWRRQVASRCRTSK